MRRGRAAAARAGAREGRLGERARRAYALALARRGAAGARRSALLATGWIGDALTGGAAATRRGRRRAERARLARSRRRSLQLFAALAASALAALDDYGTAAVGYALGSVAGLALILCASARTAIVAVAWGTSLNGAVALAIPAVRARVARGATGAGRARLASARGSPSSGAAWRCRSCCRRSTSSACASRASSASATVTSFSYAYLIASALVAVTASSLGARLVRAARRGRGSTPARRARHVVSTSWLALAARRRRPRASSRSRATRIVRPCSGDYDGDEGGGLGRLVVAARAVDGGLDRRHAHVPAPLRRAAARARLPLLARRGACSCTSRRLARREALGLDGVALALAVSTRAVLAALLLHALAAVLAAAARGLVLRAASSAGSRSPPSRRRGRCSPPAPAAALGSSLYAALLVARPAGGAAAGVGVPARA